MKPSRLAALTMALALLPLAVEYSAADLKSPQSRLGMNLAGPADWNTELPFVDWMETNGSKVRDWADRPRPDFYTCTDRGMPLELMIDLCCVFSSIGQWSKWGSWGLLEHYTDDTPKYQAVLRWNEANARN